MSTIQEDIMPRLAIACLIALFALVSAKIPVAGIVAVEREFEVYPIISQETVEIMDEMEASMNDFAVACEEHQNWMTVVENGSIEQCKHTEVRDCAAYEQLDDHVDSASGDMYAAVARRQSVSRKANFSLITTMVLGTQAYTHSTWLCAEPYSSHTFDINMGFSPTYDPA